MKIGIITWFTGPNYGTNLQAIALQYYLRKQRYAVELVNCEVESAYNKNRRTLIEKIEFFPEKWAEKFARRVFFKSEKAIRDEKLAKTIHKNCILTRRCDAEKDLVEVFNSFDLLISGSDQIWNPNWYHRFYYADYEGVTTRRISYAPSMGVTKILDEVEPEIKRSVSKFEAVSVREENAVSLLEPYSKYKPAVVVDPTLLLDSNDWASILPPTGVAPKSDYVFGFFKLQFMLDKASGYGYKKIGFILDRGYFSCENIQYMDKCGYSFVIMVKGMSALVNELILENKGTFENKRVNNIYEYGVYGKTIRHKLYASDKKERYFHLYHSISKESAERIEIEKRINQMTQYLKKHQNKVKEFGPGFEKYFNLHYDEKSHA